jgi:hypothetical protein
VRGKGSKVGEKLGEGMYNSNGFVEPKSEMPKRFLGVYNVAFQSDLVI